MSAGLNHDEYPTRAPFVSDQPLAEVVPIPAPREDGSEGQENQITAKQQELVTVFTAFAREHGNLDPSTTNAQDKPALSYAAHTFLHSTSTQLIEARVKARGESARQELIVMPHGSIKQHIRDYYAEYGVNRRTKSAEIGAEEEYFLKTRLNPVRASYRTDSTVDNHGMLIPQQKKSRASLFPEFALGLELEATLRKMGHQIGADSVEVVLATYGDRFLERIAATGNQALRGSRATRARLINEGEIPEELGRENYPRGGGK